MHLIIKIVISFQGFIADSLHFILKWVESNRVEILAKVLANLQISLFEDKEKKNERLFFFPESSGNLDDAKKKRVKVFRYIFHNLYLCKWLQTQSSVSSTRCWIQHKNTIWSILMLDFMACIINIINYLSGTWT